MTLDRGSADGRHWAYLEVNQSWTPDADTVIREFCHLIERVGPEARAAWDAANQRRFDAGYGTGTRHGSTVPILAPDTAARVGALGATIVVTIYLADRAREQLGGHVTVR